MFIDALATKMIHKAIRSIQKHTYIKFKNSERSTTNFTLTVQSSIIISYVGSRYVCKIVRYFPHKYGKEN